VGEPEQPRLDPKAEETAARYVSAIGGVGDAKARSTIFSGQYRPLFISQLTSSFGDWVGFLATIAIADKLGKSNADVAVGAVLSARMLPGFFFGAFASGLIDRWDRKKVMVVCDIGRGVIVGAIPFLRDVPSLFVASLLLELLTLMWTPAKEASVPNLVEPDQLASANSASLAAAYGTILPALLVFPLLTWVAALLSHFHYLRFFHLSQESLAIYVDVLSFFISAALLYSLRLPQKTAAQKAAIAASTLSSTWRDAKEGWRFIGETYRVRAVIIGFCTALIGGGMTVPLETTFSSQVLHKGPTAFGLLAMSLGLGVATGVLVLSVAQKRVSHDLVFGLAVLGAGVSLIFAASMSQIALVMLGIAGLGVCAGAVYVLGFTILGESTSDELRGRIFAVFYALVRLCLLLAFTLAPAISAILDGLSAKLTFNSHGRVIRHEIGTASFHVALPGTRLTLLLGGVIILCAGMIARRDLHKASKS
jgi:dTMP kinase